MARLANDIKSDKIAMRIASDQQEANKMGLGDGTPGFLINGIPVQGAQSAEYFVDLIEDLRQKGKLNI
ncbi:MAG: hypothetical protein A2504_14590 [Bdellovibrionales bacterium RIFOXYD12_FULL_39_22]|nr:MAG: hypothetical protein A2385_15070 [Bdellovibrionales bacterium RIFOXYB1_FULL_39_21]OFZ40546.1 MAG: hypothetical protein A2485_13600 [Bdellovibrionales bacterium RIFOXYC12_FULL_39_17]OFZ49538.1 MAG: hypothetical protein A2404_07805 [Bdellovibrionales bacterium RIFOXYC1_FULL_39_130]OFZ71963.1 MAG: hypothetical protein A2451_05485 [Bdellovibrionales bacterium RIFOXYC2_FULL_39_8]OFZ77142.1 MAG: hypothetical protein A2560_17835 [Bdellovibrionales bacterium RIFOXYD1_FULL_39_84]OFZ91418.1 MAG: